MKRKITWSFVLACVMVAALAMPALAAIDTNYLWSSNFKTMYAGYNNGTADKPAIRLIQKITSLYPACDGISDDGIWGAKTTSNVEKFQTAKGLTADGRVGPATWQQMQYRITAGSTDTSGNQYYKIKNTSSNAGSSGTYNYEHVRHNDDSNCYWYYRMEGGSWQQIPDK